MVTTLCIMRFTQRYIRTDVTCDINRMRYLNERDGSVEELLRSAVEYGLDGALDDGVGT